CGAGAGPVWSGCGAGAGPVWSGCGAGAGPRAAAVAGAAGAAQAPQAGPAVSPRPLCPRAVPAAGRGPRPPQLWARGTHRPRSLSICCVGPILTVFFLHQMIQEIDFDSSWSWSLFNVWQIQITSTSFVDWNAKNPNIYFVEEEKNNFQSIIKK
ncbi:hypothetical protein Nmel_016826, partial [Mimus melanotis]